jgi:hypothetical protein
MKTIIIYKGEIRNKIEAAREFTWKTGWRIPVYLKDIVSNLFVSELNEIKDGEYKLVFGSWLNTNSYVQNLLELCSIYPFASDYEDDDSIEFEITEIEESIEKEIEEILNDENIKVEFSSLLID